MNSKGVHKQVEQGIGSHALSGGSRGPQVYLRLRPNKKPTVSTTYTISQDGTELITTSKGNRLEKHFGFTSILDRSVDQSEVYERCVGPRVKAEEGMTIVTYGTSGSGKTYTLLGNEENVGIIHRALANIFVSCRDRIQLLPVLKLIRGTITPLQDEDLQKELEVGKSILDLCPSLDDNTPFKELRLDPGSKRDLDVAVLFWLSYVEIHNEMVYDLLAMPMKRFQKLQIMYNKGEVFVDGLTSVFVTNFEDALRLLRLGRERAVCASTNLNDRSSRSHCLFTLDMLKYNSSGRTTRSSFKFCDLAGSERVHTSGSTGQRLEETKNINRSLVVLGRCLDAACSMGQGTSKFMVIPHRESRLTLLLNAALLGKEQLVMIATVLPVDEYYEENQNVLTFAAIAKNIVFPEPEPKQQVLGPLDISVSAGGSDEYAKKLERDRVWWINERSSMKRKLLLVLENIKARTSHCRAELMAADAFANAEIDEKQKKLKEEIEIIMEQIEILDIASQAFDQKDDDE